MTHALFSFADHDIAVRAADRLVREGLASDDTVRLLSRQSGLVASGVAEADELVTGGFLTSLYGLFDGIFQRDQTSQHAQAYGVHLEQGGSVLCVQAETLDMREAIERVLDQEGCLKHSGWSRAQVPVA